MELAFSTDSWVHCRQFGAVLLRGCLVSALLLSAVVAHAAVEPVTAELELEQAWTGQAVPLVVTLYAPGPFSGAPAFDLPEVPLTAITTTGSPVVGSEDIEEQTWYTQRHTFHVYTQQTGAIVIPAFTVRFESEKPDSAYAESVKGTTPELQFQSQRPPGTESLGVVIAAEQLTVSQSWRPDGDETLEAGDVIERRIKIDGQETTSMMLPPADGDAPDGVRVYLGNPSVEDKVQRGECSAHRRDVIKYQFVRAGTFELPEIVWHWWDAEAEELKRETLPGRTVNVAAVAVSQKSAEEEAATSGRSGAGIVLLLVVLGALCWWFRAGIRRRVAHWRASGNHRETIAERQVITACRSGDAKAAYAAVLQWKRWLSPEQQQTGEAMPVLTQEIERLAAFLYGVAAESSEWDGSALLNAVQCVLKERRQQHHQAGGGPLPALNPSGRL